ncbi:MAG TPA: DUF1549 and DUF1553 domain-containing protein, partial [Hyphomicrobiales bacterium]|nr:DUF1549 and DUF1553 domain-containing protein [Hyphomicrobiales bacterium]
KLVDALLASPHYGERQARKWLDLARYADSTGFENDNDRPNMWRYRDYVIDSFNQDKPYDRFIQEQIAGDELWPGDEPALIATGFMAQYTDNRNARDMVLRYHQILTDITNTVGEVVLGQTVGCARCHDHKFDAISQQEYYSLQAFFANLNEVNDIPVSQPRPSDAVFSAKQAEWETATAALNVKIDHIIDEDRAGAVAYQKSRYQTDTLAALEKPEAQWTPLDRWLNHRLENVVGRGALIGYFEERGGSADPQFRSEWHAQKFEELDMLNQELRKFEALRPTLENGSAAITAMTELGHSDTPPTHVLMGGEHERPLQQVQPGFPAAIGGGPPEITALGFSSGRRAALAKWLASADNPLTARVFVNRVWEQYFGRGIVETVSDFGKAGAKPSHPELLDYLARHFIDSGWDVKALHREILLSSVYRQASVERPEVVEADPDNRLLAVFPCRRLDAEQIRDSLLAASGLLNLDVGGPSIFPPLPASAPDTGRAWNKPSDDASSHRRSLYVFTRRSLPYPLLEVFNMASPQQSHAKREVTTTPLQALTLLNSELTYDWSRALAGRVINTAGADEDARFDALFSILLARAPTTQEREELKRFLDDQERLLREQSQNGAQALALPSNLRDGQLNAFRAAAFVDLAHAVANTNEAVYRN